MQQPTVTWPSWSFSWGFYDDVGYEEDGEAWCSNNYYPPYDYTYYEDTEAEAVFPKFSIPGMFSCTYFTHNIMLFCNSEN